MAGIQRGLGAMFQQIGQSMGQWEGQKKQAEQLAMERALRERQLELAELANERAEREDAAQQEQREFDRTFQMASVLPEGSDAQPEFAASLRKFGGGGMLKPTQSNVAMPNPMTGMPGPGVVVNNPTKPEVFTGTQPPQLRSSILSNTVRQEQNAAMMNYRIQDLQRKIEQADRMGDIASIRLLTTQLMAEIARDKAADSRTNTAVDNVAAWEKRALDYAKAVVGDDEWSSPAERQSNINAAIAEFEKKNPKPTTTAAPPPQKRSGISW